jgi:ABC-type uncharacterized transport system involved in gliding motility auxiliary subunit
VPTKINSSADSPLNHTHAAIILITIIVMMLMAYSYSLFSITKCCITMHRMAIIIFLISDYFN